MREFDDMLQSLPTAYRRDAWVIALLGAVQYVYRYLLVREVHGMTINELQSHLIRDFAF